MKKRSARLAILALVVVLAVQFVPVAEINPPAEGNVEISPELKAVLRRACYDCHSNETVWPWYSRVAPVSWLIVRDVTKGRAELNFSAWSQYNTRRRARKLKEIRQQIEKGKMPQWYYVAVHSNARLSATDRELVLQWVGLDASGLGK